MNNYYKSDYINDHIILYIERRFERSFELIGFNSIIFIPDFVARICYYFSESPVIAMIVGIFISFFWSIYFYDSFFF